MLFSRIKKPGVGADNVFQVVKNANSAAALTLGQVVTWTTASTSPAVTTAPAGQPASYYVCTEVIVNPTTPLQPCGVWAEASTPAGANGLMQIYGFHSAVTAATGAIHEFAISDTTTAGRMKTGGADPYATGTSGTIGEIVVAVASNLCGVHIKLM
jgi:hypothetical protein